MFLQSLAHKPILQTFQESYYINDPLLHVNWYKELSVSYKSMPHNFNMKKVLERYPKIWIGNLNWEQNAAAGHA